MQFIVSFWPWKILTECFWLVKLKYLPLFLVIQLFSEGLYLGNCYSLEFQMYLYHGMHKEYVLYQVEFLRPVVGYPEASGVNLLE